MQAELDPGARVGDDHFDVGDQSTADLEFGHPDTEMKPGKEWKDLIKHAVDYRYGKTKDHQYPQAKQTGFFQNLSVFIFGMGSYRKYD